MSSARDSGSTSNDTPLFDTFPEPHTLTSSTLRNQQAFDSNQQLLGATRTPGRQSNLSAPAMQSEAPVFTEPVIASSDRYADIAPYMGRIYNADPQKWGSILPWEFPQDSSKRSEEYFLRAAFGDFECHIQGFRFLKQVWYSIAKWNFEIRVPAIAEQWMDHNKDIWTDPTLVEFVLKPSAELRTFSFAAEDVGTYGEKLLGWAVKHIQYLVQLKQHDESSTVKAKGSVTDVESELVQTSVLNTSATKHSPEQIVVDSKQPEGSEDSEKADVTKSAELAPALPVVLDTPPKTAPIRSVSSSGEPSSNFDSSAHMPPGFQVGSDAMYGPAIHNRKRGNSGGGRRFSNYSGGSGRANQKWQPQAPFAPPPFQRPPFRDPSFPHAAAPPVHMQHEMSFLSGGVQDFLPSQQPPPGFQNTGPHLGPSSFDNGPIGPQHGFMPGPMLAHGPVSQPPVYQNAYYNSHDPSHSFNDRSNGRDGIRVFSGSNMPWSQHNEDFFGYNKYGAKRRESMSTRGGSTRGRGGSFGRGGKGSRGRNSLSNAGRRELETFAGDGTFQYLDSHQQRVDPPASGQFSSDARNAEGNAYSSMKWRRRRDTLQLENLPPTRDISDEPSTQQPRAATMGTRQSTSGAAVNDRSVAEAGKVNISITRGESMEVWTSSRIPRDGDLISDKECPEPPIKPIHDPTCREAQEHPERVLTENFIGRECTHVRKLIVFGVPLTLPLEQLAAYFQDHVGAVDKISRNPMRFVMGPFDSAAHQCWITFASHLDAKKAVEMAQGALHWFHGILLRVAVPFEYCKEEHKSYPGFEFPHLHKEASSAFNREARTRRWSSHYDSRPSARTSAINGTPIPAVVPEAQSVEDKGEASGMSSHQTRPRVTGAEGNGAVSGSGTTTPAPSVGPTPKKNKNKNKKSKKAKASSDVASANSARHAEPDAESSSNGLKSHAAEAAPTELRKASESSTEGKYQAASEPSFSPEVAMKAQLPKIALPPPDQRSASKPHGPVQDDDFPKVGSQKEPTASTTREVVVEQLRGDAPGSATSGPATEPESVRASGNTKECMENASVPRLGDEKRVISPNESPNKSDFDDSFHTAADSPNDAEKHSKQGRSRGMSSTTDSSTVVALPATEEISKDTANSDNRSAAASATVAADEVMTAISPASTTSDKDVRKESSVSEARSTKMERPAQQVKPVSVEVFESAQSIQRSASTLSAVPPTPGLSTAPATSALASSPLAPSGPSASAPSQPLKKDQKPKGPTQTESLSLYSRKKAPKPQKQKSKKGGSRAVSSNADVESNASRVVSRVSTPDVQQGARRNDHALSSNNASLANVNALAKQADSSALPNTVSPSSMRHDSSNLNSSAKQTTQQETAATSSNEAPLKPDAPQNQDSSMASKSLSGVSSAFRSPRSSDASARPDCNGSVQGGQSAAEINSEDSWPCRPNTTPPSTGADAIAGPHFHPLSAFRGGGEPRDSGHSGGQHDIPSHDIEHSVVGLGISSAAGQLLSPADEAKSKAKKKKAKKRKKDDGKGTDDEGAEKTGLSVITDKSNSISTSQPSPFAFQFTSNSPVKLSEHDDIGRISHTRPFDQSDSQSQTREDHSEQSSQALDGSTAQATREPTPSSTAASEPSPMKKKIELLQGKRTSKLVVEAPPVKRPASAASNHARRQSSIASAKSSESLTSAGPETRRSSTRVSQPKIVVLQDGESISDVLERVLLNERNSSNGN
ncbi:hypothetical protein Tdes44962_MAKER00087 [Teratosphaeria destructans]|uniref:RRM domain-containing protein n=1 Tax=Teratosphaeria destructans TaxID=418781 RepID=A0A9W7T1P2_9PEZI|nr:hypothetical protein Tdes44962_MAKER00087 [Teratosphaeria destructans]